MLRSRREVSVFPALGGKGGLCWWKQPRTSAWLTSGPGCPSGRPLPSQSPLCVDREDGHILVCLF